MMICFPARWWVFPKVLTVACEVCRVSELSSSLWVSLGLSARLCGSVAFYRVAHSVTSHLSANETRHVRGWGDSSTLIFLLATSSPLNNVCVGCSDWITSQLLHVFVLSQGVWISVCACGLEGSLCVFVSTCQENQTFSQGHKIPWSEDFSTVLFL